MTELEIEQTEHPETARLAQAAFDASGVKSHREFIALFDGAIGMRTFRAWLKGEAPALPLARLVLREVAAGWLPKL